VLCELNHNFLAMSRRDLSCEAQAKKTLTHAWASSGTPGCCFGLTRRVSLSIRPREPAARAQQLIAEDFAVSLASSAIGRPPGLLNAVHQDAPADQILCVIKALDVVDTRLGLTV
jgi:hypothetical protein